MSDLDPKSFMKWGRQLALTVQQELVSRLPEELSPNVAIRTDGSQDDSFAFVVSVSIKRTHFPKSCTVYIYRDKLISDPKDYNVHWSNRRTFDDAVNTTLDVVAANLQLGLTESRLKHALAAGAVAAAALSGSAPHDKQEPISHELTPAEHAADLKRIGFKAHIAKERIRAEKLAAAVKSKYKNVKPELVDKVVKLAIKHEKPVFPKAEDILSVIGVESAFQPTISSNLKHDPAVGLMQVRPGIFGLDRAKFKADIEAQVKFGSNLLHKLYDKVKSKEGALQSYNVGITNYMNKKGLNPRYVPKVNNELKMYEALTGLKDAVFKLQQLFIDEGYDVKLVPDEGNLFVLVRKLEYRDHDNGNRRLIGATSVLHVNLQTGVVNVKLGGFYTKDDFSD